MPRPSATAVTPTRERILDEAERLIAIKGVYGFALRDISAPLRMRVPAIYKHYKSRDDVLVGVSRRFIALLARQFYFCEDAEPIGSLREALDAFVALMMAHPAYVRLSLADLATPGGGMDYVKLAAGGSFKDNLAEGPLAPLHARLRAFVKAGERAKQFRAVKAEDLYLLLKGSLLTRLVFPDDALLLRRPSAGEVRETQRWLWDVAIRYLQIEGIR